MKRSADAERTDTETLESVDQVLTETVRDGESRRSLMIKAGGLLAAGGALAVPGVAEAAGHASTAGADPGLIAVLATFEAFDVTALTNAVKRAPGKPAAQFLPVLKSANATEWWHLQELRKMGGKPFANRFWIPDAVLQDGVALLQAIAAQEAIEISAYLVAVTQASKKRNAFQARFFAEALGTEAEHKVLARSAAAALSGSGAVPNTVGFEPFPQRSAAAALKASEALGIGFGKPGAAPGAFYDFPGNPLSNGTALPVTNTVPS